MSIARKLFFLAASFALPIIVLGWLVVRSINEHVAFAQYELAGTAYLRPLEALLRDLPDYQRLARGCTGADGCGERVAALRKAVGDDLAALRAADRRYGTLLRFTSEGLARRGRQLCTADNVELGWRRIAGDPEARADGLVEILQTMITHVNDTSNLILDPELDTYHLVAVSSLLLPRTQERLARAMTAGGRTPAERMALATQAAFLEQEREQVKFHLDTALSENGNRFHGFVDSFQHAVPAAYAEFAGAEDGVLALLHGAAAGSPPAPGAVLAAGERARAASFRLWETSIEELDKLIRARIAYYVRRRATALLLSGSALLLACLLAFWIAASLIVPLGKLSRLLTPGADLLDASVRKLAGFTERDVQDLTAMRIVCDELDEHAEDMRAASRELASIVDGREP